MKTYVAARGFQAIIGGEAIAAKRKGEKLELPKAAALKLRGMGLVNEPEREKKEGGDDNER